MINRLAELKNKAIERNNYYSNIGFTNLANEFAEFVKFFDEIENVIKDNEELKARVQTLEEKFNAKITEAGTARDAEGYE